MLNRLRKNKEQLKQEVAQMEQIELELANQKDINPGNFVGFVLLDAQHFDFVAFEEAFKNDWKFDITSRKKQVNNQYIFEIEDVTVSIELKNTPVDNEHIIENASANFYWQEAVEVTKEHQAHLVLAVFNKDASAIDAGKVFVKVAASLLKQEHATAINTLDIVFRGGFYRDNALLTMNTEKRFPLLNLVFLELYTTDGTSVSAYTYGLEHLGKKEIEIIESKNSMEDVHLLLYNTVSYTLDYDVDLHSGETIGFSEDQKLEIVESLGFALNPDKTTLKIDY